MPYKMVCIEKNGKRTEMKPLAFDNPKSLFVFEDRTIERKGKILAKKMKKFEDVQDCYIEHY
jgi:hypothetical protein